MAKGKGKISIKKDECPECGSSNIIYKKEKDQIICKDCGAIFEQLNPEEEKKFEEAHKQK